VFLPTAHLPTYAFTSSSPEFDSVFVCDSRLTIGGFGGGAPLSLFSSFFPILLSSDVSNSPQNQAFVFVRLFPRSSPPCSLRLSFFLLSVGRHSPIPYSGFFPHGREFFSFRPVFLSESLAPPCARTSDPFFTTFGEVSVLTSNG